MVRKLQSLLSLGILTFIVTLAGIGGFLPWQNPVGSRAQTGVTVDIQATRDIFSNIWSQGIGQDQPTITASVRWQPSGLAEGTGYVYAVWCDLNDPGTNYTALVAKKPTSNSGATIYSATVNSGFGNGWVGFSRFCTYNQFGSYTIKLLIGVPDIHGQTFEDRVTVLIPGTDSSTVSQGLSCGLFGIAQACVGQPSLWAFSSNPTGKQAYWHGTKDGATDVADQDAGITNQQFNIIYACGDVGVYTRYLHVADGLNHSACTTNTVTIRVADCDGNCSTGTGAQSIFTVNGVKSGTFAVGSAWKLELSGAPKSTDVIVCAKDPVGTQTCTPAASLSGCASAKTDATGAWTCSGTFDIGTVGNWIEWTQVGPTRSNDVTFTVSGDSLPPPVPPPGGGGSCTQNFTLVSGFAAPCPVFGISSPPAGSKTATVTIAPIASATAFYTYTKVYISKTASESCPAGTAPAQGSADWCQKAIQYPSTAYVTGSTDYLALNTGGIGTLDLTGFSTGPRWVVLWDWNWNPNLTYPGKTAPGCYMGPGGTGCFVTDPTTNAVVNAGGASWRIQAVNVP